MHWIDLAADIAASRHAGHVVVTASMDRLELLHPVQVGEVVRLEARLNWVGRTSMEVEVRVDTENMETGEVRKTSTAFLTFVALDRQGVPIPIPPLILMSLDEEERFHVAEGRRAERLRGKQGRV